MRTVLACLFALALSACSPTTGVMVRVDAQPGATESAARMRIRVLSADGVVRLDESRALDSVALPLRVPIVPEGNDASRAWIVEATLLSAAGVQLGHARARGTFARGEVRDASLCLYAACAGEACSPCDGGDCTTCIDGTCSAAASPLYPAGAAPRCPAAGTVDGGMPDAAGPDTGTVDAGAQDAGMEDAGTQDAGCSPSPEDGTTSCADGLDNDCDGLVDCAQPSCCALPSCNGRACGGGGRRCCDLSCVDTLASEAHCGVCGNACASGRLCVRVPGMTAADPSPGAACRCAVGSTECAGLGVCESHDSTSVCNCETDAQCGAGVCRHQGVMHHTYCEY